jgi:farnesyl diphosphate synthase
MFGVSRTTLDAPAAAVEASMLSSLMHARSPAMDDDDLRAVCRPATLNLAKRTQFLPETPYKTLAFLY